MDFQVFHSFLFVIIAILLGITGIIFLTLGLINSQAKQWLPGLVCLLLAVFIGITGIINSIVSISEKVEKISHAPCPHQNKFNADSLAIRLKPVDSTFAEPVSGFIEDAGKNLVFLKIYPHQDLLKNKVSLQQIDKGNTEKDNTTIAIFLHFGKSFSGKLQLSIYSSDEVFLGESLVHVSGNPGSQIKFNFPFSANTVNFSEADYGTLKIIQ